MLSLAVLLAPGLEVDKSGVTIEDDLINEDDDDAAAVLRFSLCFILLFSDADEEREVTSPT